MDDLFQEAKDCYETDAKHWRPIYDLAQEDEEFMSGDPGAQWNSQDYQARRNSGRPCLEIDQLNQFEKQVENDIRRNTPSIKVIPTGSQSSMDDAEIYRGLIRGIEYKSHADVAYDNGVSFSIRSSIGFIGIETDYETDTGMDQVLKIVRKVNPRSCMMDSRSVQSDGSDAMWAWEEEPAISIKEFQRQFPDEAAVSWGSDSRGKDDKDIVIMRWYRVEEENYTIGQLDDGTIEEADDNTDYAATRDVTIRKVMVYRMSGKKILKKFPFPGKYVPLVPVYGEEAWVNGERRLFSLIRRSKDGQRMFNVWKSLEAELLLQQPRAPIMAAVGQVEDFSDEWSNPDKVAVLRYNPVDINGTAIGAPQRLAPPQIPAGIVNGARESVDDIKATMGIYNAALGQEGNETSGKAINARKLEGDTATYHFGDNLVRSITQVGRILVSAIPEVYDAPRIVHIINDEDEPEAVGINGSLIDGQKITHFLTRGQYDVRVITGSSFATRRQEAADLMGQLAQNPEVMKVAPDLIFKYLDIEGADALSARFAKLVPANLKDDDAQPEDPRVAQMAQIIQQGMQEIQALQQQLMQAKQELQSKQADLALRANESQNKAAKDGYELQVKEMQLQIDQQDLQLEAYKAETERLKLIQEMQGGGKPPLVPGTQDPDSEGVLVAKIQDIQNRRMQDAEMQRQQVQAEAVKQQQAVLAAQQSQQTQAAFMEILMGIKQGIDGQTAATQQLTNTIASPRRIVTDGAGNPIGTTIGNA